MFLNYLSFHFWPLPPYFLLGFVLCDFESHLSMFPAHIVPIYLEKLLLPIEPCKISSKNDLCKVEKVLHSHVKIMLQYCSPRSHKQIRVQFVLWKKNYEPHWDF